MRIGAAMSTQLYATVYDVAMPVSDVRQVEVGDSARARLPDAHYADAFCVLADGPHPAEEWARRTLEAGPPGRQRLFALLAWRGALGLRLGPTGSHAHVAGWQVVDDEPGTIVVRADSWMLAACMVFDATDADATMTTLLRYDRPPARAVWTVESIAHRALAGVVLAGAARSLERGPRTVRPLRTTP